MRFIDTNIFIRAISNDIPKKARECDRLFTKIKKGQVKVTTSEAVISEVVYVLSSSDLYKQPRKEVRNNIYPFLLLKGMSIPNETLILKALDLYAQTKLDFEDALIVIKMKSKGIKKVYSYDKHFDKIKGIKRIEP